MKHSKIAIIGSGAVGSTIAYSLILNQLVSEIIMVDVDKKRCEGEILDLSDSIAFSKTSCIYQGDFKDAAQADIIIISAGRAQKLGQDRLELLQVNINIIKSIFEQLKPLNRNAIVIMVTNPLDLMTYYAAKFCDLPKSQIIGTGTFLDSLRLHVLLAQKLKVSANSINGYIIGEHGDSQVVAWSGVRVGTQLFSEFNINNGDLIDIEDAIKNQAYKIIECKGATYYGIAACVAKICQIIIFNEKEIIPLSIYNQEYDICFSLPVILSEQGIIEVIDLKLNDIEKNNLQKSINKLKSQII